MTLFDENAGKDVMPPGEFIRQELEAKKWSQADLARIIERPLPTINEIIQGKRAVMPEMAKALEKAFGTRAEKWMEREATYRLAQLNDPSPDIQLRRKLWEFAPIKDMEKRGWIRPTNDPTELCEEIYRFFNISSIDDNPTLPACARQTVPSEEFSTIQRAWLFRAAQLAKVTNAKPFNREYFINKLPSFRDYAHRSEDCRHVPRLLADLGVRLVVVETLPRAKIDGACFWIGTAADQPVIALSLRFDRIDWFWHTLMHELVHIKHGDQRSVDVALLGENRTRVLDEIESRADREAAELLVPASELDSFVRRASPTFPKKKILQFSNRIKIHPGIVNGQLQHAGQISWRSNREMHVPVRDFITTMAVTDGFKTHTKIGFQPAK